MRRASSLLAVAGAAAAFTQCTLTTSLEGLAGDPRPAGGVEAGAGPNDAALYPEVPPGGCLCTEPPPAGWQGPVEVADTTSGAAAECVDDYGAELFAGTADPTAGPAACSCSPCTAPNGESCPSSFNVDLHPQTSCATIAAIQPLTVNACTNVSGASLHGVTWLPPRPSGSGVCRTLETSEVSPPSWGRAARVCTTTAPPRSGSCGGKQVCVPPPRAPFLPRLCVVGDGAIACPAGSPYAVKHVYYAGAADTRACTTCACAPATGNTCIGTFHLFDSPSCAVETGAYPLTSACTSILGTPPGGMTVETLVAAGGSCALSGGLPTGSFTPYGAKTVCCLP